MEFQEPRLALNRIYTKRGDSGETALVGGQRLPKDALRIECYGAVDELNACVGLLDPFRARAESSGLIGEPAVPVWSAIAVKPVAAPVFPIRL